MRSRRTVKVALVCLGLVSLLLPVAGAGEASGSATPAVTGWERGLVAAVDQEDLVVLLPGDVPLELVRIPAGSFRMGRNCESTRTKVSDTSYTYTCVPVADCPEHVVTLTQPYYMGKVEVTQEQWTAVMGSNPSRFVECGPTCPVEHVSWTDICGSGTVCGESGGFIKALNDHLIATGQIGAAAVRLPREAEWEFAALAGEPDWFGVGVALNGWAGSCTPFPMHDERMWWCGNAGGTTHPVGEKLANQFGLHDVHGNVWEWVADYYQSDYYWVSTATDPQGPDTGRSRVIRGGGWAHGAWNNRSTIRVGFAESAADIDIGFRLAMTAE